MSDDQVTAPAPTPDKKPWYKRVPWWGWVAGILALALIGGISNMVNPREAPSSSGASSPSDSDTVGSQVVPNVVGMTGSDARKALQDQKLTADFDAGDDYVIAASNWTVLSQTPEAGANAEKYSTVVLVVQKTDSIWEEADAATLVDAVTLAWPQAFGVENLTEIRDSDASILAGYVESITSTDVKSVTATLSSDAPTVTDAELVQFARASLSLVGSSVDDLNVLTVLSSTDQTATATRSEIPLLGGSPKTTPSGLTSGTAQQACNNYGDREFVYGFSPKWIRTGIGAVTGDAWQFKVETTIKNAYGTKATMIVECTVGGTDAAPTVTHFAAY